jgi:hypothetical protein
MEENIAVGKRDHFGITRTFMSRTGFKMAAPSFLGMANVQNNLDKSSLRTIKAQESRREIQGQRGRESIRREPVKLVNTSNRENLLQKGNEILLKS